VTRFPQRFKVEVNVEGEGNRDGVIDLIGATEGVQFHELSCTCFSGNFLQLCAIGKRLQDVLRRLWRVGKGSATDNMANKPLYLVSVG
jgi:hypothetical protein